MLPERKGLTLPDLQAIDDGNRYELIDSDLYLLASPAPVHMVLCSKLTGFLFKFFDGKTCNVFFAPADIFLFNEPGDSSDNVHTVVQPDIFVICDQKQITPKGVYGPPALAVEILSPSTAGMDRFIKYFKYQQAGVKEYWITDPKSETVVVYTLTDGRYAAGEVYTSVMTLHSELFPGLEIPLCEVFSSLTN